MMDRLQSPVHPKCRSQTRKFDRGLMHLHHTEWHWLDVPERVQYKRGVTVHQCMQHKAPQYLVDCCTPSSNIASHQRLRSVSSTCRDINGASLIVGPSPSQAPLSGTLYQLTSVTRR